MRGRRVFTCAVVALHVFLLASALETQKLVVREVSFSFLFVYSLLMEKKIC